MSAGRRLYYGASDVASILGLPGAFRTPFELWSEKTGRTPPEDLEDDPDILRGRKLEAGVLELLGHRLGAEVRPGDPVEAPPVRDPGVSPYAGCHPDGWIDPDAGAEVKVPRKAIGWGDDGDSDAVPPKYLTQSQVCMALTGRRRWYLAALLYGDVRVYPLDYDEGLTRDVIAACDAWWERHVIGDEPPEIDGSPAASAWVARRLRKGTARDATDAERADILEYVRLGEEAKRIEAARAEVKARLLTAAGDTAEIGTGFDRKRWGLRISAVAGRRSVDLDRLTRDFPAAAAACVRTGEPFVQLRTFGLSKE